jgi:hypothetical protein
MANKVLSVHIDCQDRTYDAKGDGKGWTSWGEERAVYERAIAACRSGGEGTQGENMALKWEQAKASLAARKEEEAKAIKEKRYDLEWCISASLANLKDQSQFWELQPDMVGLKSRDQVSRLIVLIQASLEDDCNGELNLIKAGASPQRIELYWAKSFSSLMEKVR